MNKKLLLFVICLLTFSFVNAQTSIAVVGDGAGGWPTGGVDIHQMTKTGTDTWVLNNLTLTLGSVKFRGENTWGEYDWGGTTLAAGTGIQYGASITTAPGVYNVTFNSSTLAYTFVKQDQGFQVIGIIGTATPGVWTTDTDMTTTDGNIYTLTNASLVPGELKFRFDHAWSATTNWGGTFPSGTGVVDGDAVIIPTAGLYNITFNKTTHQFSFSFQVVSIIGSVLAADWSIELDMNTTDGNIYTLNNVTLMPGALKLRGDHAWTSPYNWGITAFPSGTAQVNVDGTNLATDGKFDITFNKTTLAFSITTAALGVEDFNTIAFKAYPNPTQNNWTFSSSEENLESIVITNITGQTVKTIAPKSNQATVDASNLTTGVYFAKVTTATATQTLKLIKQ